MGKKSVNKQPKSRSKRGPYRIRKQSPKRAIRRGVNERKSRLRKGLKFVPDHQGQGRKSRSRPRSANPKRTDVGPGRPPKEHQFQPGVSGNPAGCPRRRSFLHWWICKYLEMTAAERRFIRRKGGLTGSQQAAMTSVEQCIKRGIAGTSWLAMRELMHYDEGKPTEHVAIKREEGLTPEECELIRQEYARKFARD